MAKSVRDAELLHAAKFLSPQHLLRDKENNADLDASLCFPSEFPLEFDSFRVPTTLSSPGESVAGSTEVESSDEEDFFAGLTRRLSQSTLHDTRKLTVRISASDKAESQKSSAIDRSPQSTLSGIGSWSGRSAVSGDGSPSGPSQAPSPPTTPFSAENDAWNVIYAAAGQVARLKMNREVYRYDLQDRGVLNNPGAATPRSALRNPSVSLYPNQSQGLPQPLNQPSHVQNQQVLKQQCASVWARQAKVEWLSQQQQQQQIQNRGPNCGYRSVECGRPLSSPQSSWPSLQVHPQNQQVQPNGSGSRAFLNGGSGGKRGCAGTGVFLPRQYGNPPESRKKTSCPPVQPSAKVVHALNRNIHDLNASSEARISEPFATDFDALIARRNALLMQQRLSLRPEQAALNHEIRLPQEWTY